MKYYTRLKIYKASAVTFNPETLEAYSYDWWRFVEKIGNKLVFNSYGYSNSTRKHQAKVRTLLSSLGIEIDVDVESPAGLQYGGYSSNRPTNGLESAIPYYQRKIDALREAMANPRSLKRKNLERRREIKFLEKKIKQVQSLIKVQRKQDALVAA